MCRFAPEISADKEENRGNPDGFQDFLTQSSGNLWREAVCGDLISGSFSIPQLEAGGKGENARRHFFFHLVDRFIVQVAPVLLGAGIPLFTQKEALRRFRLEEVRKYGQFAELVYGRL